MPGTQAMQSAVADALAADGLMLTKMVLITEALRPDGERTVMVEASDELRTWDIAGLLAAAASRTNALMAAEWAPVEDDEGG